MTICRRVYYDVNVLSVVKYVRAELKKNFFQKAHGEDEIYISFFCKIAILNYFVLKFYFYLALVEYIKYALNTLHFSLFLKLESLKTNKRGDRSKLILYNFF